MRTRFANLFLRSKAFKDYETVFKWNKWKQSWKKSRSGKCSYKIIIIIIITTAIIIIRFRRTTNAAPRWLKKMSVRYLQNIPEGDVKSNSWPSRGRTVSNHQERAKGGYIWRVKTSTLGRMSSIVLPAVILEEGKSLISKPGEMGLFSHGRQPI